MALVPAVTDDGPLFVTARSALVAIEPVTVEELFAAFGSEVVLVTDAESEKLAPLARVLGAETTRVKVSVCPVPTAALAVSVMVPVPWEKVKLSGLLAPGVMDTKTAPAGRVSVRTTAWAELGPLLVKVIV